MSEPKTRHVKVFLTPASAHSWVEIDGVRQTNVRGITIHGSVGAAASVTLELTNVQVEVEAQEATTFVETTHLASENREYRDSLPTIDQTGLVREDPGS